MGYIGIDYGLGKTNIDLVTGIRYGVIPMNDLGYFAFDSFEADYGKASCPKCGQEASEGEKEEYACVDCSYEFDADEAFSYEPLGFYLEDGEYEATLDEQGDVFILKSPYYTFAGFCSPCAPGAGHLRTIDPEGVKTYCFGKDWFEDEKAPYPIYRVSDNSLVE
jgi:hypothetical protein